MENVPFDALPNRKGAFSSFFRDNLEDTPTFSIFYGEKMI
jgi:hypothetical protein